MRPQVRTALTARALKGDGEVVAVDIGDDAVAGGGVGFLDCVVVDIEFGQVDLEAGGLRAVDELAQALAQGLARPAEMWDWMPRASRGRWQPSGA